MEPHKISSISSEKVKNSFIELSASFVLFWVGVGEKEFKLFVHFLRKYSIQIKASTTVTITATYSILRWRKDGWIYVVPLEWILVGYSF